MGAENGGLDRVVTNERRFLSRCDSRPADEVMVLECECTQATCDERIELTSRDYQPIRASAARYAIWPGEAHVDRTLDRLVERHISHWVVERSSTVETLAFFTSANDSPSQG
jgi:hypothetical protein